MYIFNNPCTNPYINAATEEFLLKQRTEDFFMLWQNDNAIVVGKHQNALAEINANYTRQQETAVVRRLSGGGTVFHDLGNINYSFILNGTQGKLVDFKRYTADILAAIRALQVDAQLNQRNDLVIGKQKISGNAEHLYKNKVLHHGTLLFSSDLTALNRSIEASLNHFQDKSVQSVRSTVTNIQDHLTHQLSVADFKQHILQFMHLRYPTASSFTLTDAEKLQIETLANEKYKTWDWNFGYSPAYTFRHQHHDSIGASECELRIKAGKIQSIELQSDFMNAANIEKIKNQLLNEKHQIEHIQQLLSIVPKTWQEHLLNTFFVQTLRAF